MRRVGFVACEQLSLCVSRLPGDKDRIGDVASG